MLKAPAATTYIASCSDYFSDYDNCCFEIYKGNQGFWYYTQRSVRHSKKRIQNAIRRRRKRGVRCQCFHDPFVAFLVPRTVFRLTRLVAKGYRLNQGSHAKHGD